MEVKTERKIPWLCRIFGHRWYPVDASILRPRDRETGQQLAANFKWCKRNGCLEEELIVDPNSIKGNLRNGNQLDRVS